MEVMAALVLLATVGVMILQIESRYRRQSHQAQRRTEAVRIADALLADWWRQPRGIPRSSSGLVAGEGGFSWRTAPRADAVASELGGQIVRLEIFETNNPASALAAAEVVVSNRVWRAGQQR